MAATPSPLIWDFYREVSGAAGLGSVLEYYDTESQSLYLDSGIQTRTATVTDGHWVDAVPGPEIEITEEAYAATSWDHPFTGLLAGAGDLGDELWYFRYHYAMELSDLIQEGSWQSRNDSRVAQMDLTLKNAGAAVFLEDTSIFEPGARITLAVTMGDSAPYDIGQAYLDEINFDAYSLSVPLSGRNVIGYRLLQQTFDTNTSFTGNGNEVVAWIFGLAGITRYIIGPSDYSIPWAFDPDETLWKGLEKVFQVFTGWDVEELPDGRLIVGYPHLRATYQHNSAYQFNGNTEVIKRKTRKNADGAYAHVLVTGLDANGVELTPVYLAVQNWEHWELGALKTKHIRAADGLTQAQLQAYAEQIAAELQHIGVAETFDGPIRPQLLVGDVASITFGDGRSSDLGLITSITHQFGEQGFFTSFTVDSGGVAATEAGYIATRSAAVDGYNRNQNIADLIGIVANGGDDASAASASGSAKRASESAAQARGYAADAERAKVASQEAQSAAEAALAEFSTPRASADTLAPGSPATASYENGNFAFGIPAGAPGAQGNPGPNQVTGDTVTNLTGILAGSNGKVATWPVDATPTEGSGNLVTSGGVKTALDEIANACPKQYWFNIGPGKKLTISIGGENYQGQADALIFPHSNSGTLNGGMLHLSSFDKRAGFHGINTVYGNVPTNLSITNVEGKITLENTSANFYCSLNVVLLADRYEVITFDLS